MNRALLLRWSWRDLRARWPQVAAIALIIALGSGIYSGLSSTGRWRRVSYDESFAQLAMHDLRVQLATGSYVDADALLDAVRTMDGASRIRAAEPRLIARTQVDASNDLVVTAAGGADLDGLRRDLRQALRARFPDVGFEVLERRDDDTYRLLYDDIEGDQRFYDIFAVLILAGAAFAAFNLVGRIVEAQRREIGIGMAIGVSPSRLAVRPLLVGAQIAALGAIFGVAVGFGVAAVMGNALEGLFPLPVWRFPFQADVFVQGAALGLVIPMLATVAPVWRAVRVPPIQAIRTGANATGGRVPLLARVPLPGRTTAELPFRNVLRVPRRTVMTVLGIAAAITVLIGVVGMVDSFQRTIDVTETEITGASPRRLSVMLESFEPETGPTVSALRDSTLVAAAEPGLRIGGTVERGDLEVDVLLQLLPLDDGVWEPTIDDRVSAGDRPGIVLAEKAARDLGVEPGETVTLRHPRRTGLTSYDFVRSPVVVLGVSPLPTRFVAFMDSSDADLMGLQGIANSVAVVPARGASTDRVERELFGVPGVASVQPIVEFTETIRNEIDRFLGILTVVEAAILLLALLIAFNSASISADERARDHATMFAFGLPLRTVARMNVVESTLIGVLGTALGLGIGWLLLGWLVNSLIPETFPDLGIEAALAWPTIATALGLGILAVACAPLLTLRRLRRMDVPSTLRVME